jgi:serine/threonine protein kinase
VFRNTTFTPFPRLEFEYVHGGSLETYSNLSTLESTQILCQLSSALKYLHNQQPSVGHRDIKPENILVVERGVDGVYVKFADFGLSKAADILQTFCGTLRWAAPEIYLKAADRKGAAHDKYSVAVDIWSLGVVIAYLECGLPEYENAWATDAVAWIHAVQSHVSDHFQQRDSELLLLISDKMLVEDPKERSLADYCNSCDASLTLGAKRSRVRTQLRMMTTTVRPPQNLRCLSPSPLWSPRAETLRRPRFVWVFSLPPQWLRGTNQRDCGRG